MNLPPALPRMLFCGLLASLPIFAHGTDFHVTTTLDEYDGICDAHCSLRDAVAAANQAAGFDRILLQAGTYTLSLPASLDDQGVPYDEDDNLNGDLDVRDTLLIQGISHEETFISRSTSEPSYDRILEVLPSTSLTLRRLTLEKGRTAYNGGAVENHGQLHLLQVQLFGNQAYTANPDYQPILGEEGYRRGQGGGIANYGDLVIHASYFIENRSRGEFEANEGRGGAIFNRGRLRVRDSLFRGNVASDESELGAGAGIYNEGLADIARSAFHGNRGAEGTRGFAIANVINGRLLLSNSTLSGHYGTNGALTNGDRFHRDPAGTPRAVLSQVTIAGNQGFGVRNSGELLIRNSIVAGNLGIYEDEVTNCINDGDAYRFRAVGLVLNSEPSNCASDFALPYEQTFTDLLEPLGENGGRTETFALRPGSMAIDTAIGSCSSHDQRGYRRPQDGNGDGVEVCDLGAFERAGP